MAKILNILQGARGRLGGGVLQGDGRGGTMVRERVVPRDPRSEGQLRQRILMATVLPVFCALKALLALTFEGLEGVRPAMARYMTLNLNLLRQQWRADGDGAGDAAVRDMDGAGGTAVSGCPIGSRWTVPNAYIIAEGSLPRVAVTLPEGRPTLALVGGLADNSYQALLDACGLRRGDVLAFVGMTGSTAERTACHVVRVVLDPHLPDGSQAPLTVPFVADDGAVGSPSPANEGRLEALAYDEGSVAFGFIGGVLTAAGIVAMRRNGAAWLVSPCQLTVSRTRQGRGFWSGRQCLDYAQGRTPQFNDVASGRGQASEGAGLQAQTGGFVQAEHEVHVLHGLAHGTLQEVVDGRGDENFPVETVDMHQGLVGVDHLLQVDGTVGIVGEGGVGIEVAVALDDVGSGGRGVHHGGAEDATGEVAAVGDELNLEPGAGSTVTALATARSSGASGRGGHLRQTLHDFGQVLVGEGLVDAQVVVAPREVCGGTGLLTGTRRARDGIHADGTAEQTHLCRRQQRQLDARGKAAGVGQVARLTDLGAVDLGQTVDEVVALAGQCQRVAPDAEVLRQVDDLDMRRHGVLAEKGLALPVTKAEEKHVYGVKGHRVCEAQRRVADEPFMDVGNEVAGIALTVGKDDVGLGVVQQQAEELTARVARCTKNAYFHKYICSYVLTLFVFMDTIVNAERRARHLDETLGLVGSPARLSLAILAQLRLGEVVRTVYADSFEAVRTELQDGGTRDVALA